MSDIGIEKVVVELNGFRQRTAMIKEEISKVSRALNERAQQLNDLVNKSLSQLRDQLGGTTLSGYLSLQGRYQSGEMSDQDYNAQKDYYKGEMANMIRKLDESKKLMMIMAQLDSRPPGAAQQMPQGQSRPNTSQ
ncbi:CdvA-like protein [Candidatus Bathyarchaeota archaeon]|nr:CdvA-like protein [Candidatus Bathyarchaeota archaeon]